MQDYAAIYLQQLRMEQAAKHAERARMIREARASRPKLSSRLGVIFKDLASSVKSGSRVPRPA